MPNLVGIGNSQVPTNAMLGGLAYQDSVGEIDLEKIKARASDTAVDIFVYDTRKDSDGGAWRHRTQDLSWYNEGANALRGARKEFPTVAVLVLQSLKLTIYDGDDPNLPMWMVLTGANNNYAIETQATCTTALNGIVCIGCGGNGHDFYYVDFLRDAAYEFSTGAHNRFADNIATRSSHNRNAAVSSSVIISRKINDVAMKVLPNAPIGDVTGLPVPTIALATDDGVSVIKNLDGTENGTFVVDITSNTIIHHDPRNIDFLGNRLLWTEGNNYDLQDRAFLNSPIPGSDIALSHLSSLPSGFISYGVGGNQANTYADASVFLNMTLRNEFNTGGNGRERKFQISGSDDHIIFGSKHATEGGLEQIHQDTDSPSNGLVNSITTTYNTGWMNHDCKLVVCADTDTTNISSTNLMSGATYNSSARVDSYSYTNGSSTLTINDQQSTADGYVNLTLGGLTASTHYVITATANQSYTPTTGYNHHVGSTADGTVYFEDNFVGTTQTQKVTFKAPSSGNPTIVLYSGYNGALTYTLDLRLAEQDRSGGHFSGYNSAQNLNITSSGFVTRKDALGTYGTINKSPVATGAEFVAYNFPAATSYLKYPYDADVCNVGTGDFSVMGWFYNTPRGVNFFDLASAASPRFFVAQMYNSDNFWFYINSSSGAHSWTTGGSGIESKAYWQFIAVKRVGTKFSYSFNGKDFLSQTNDAWAGSISGGTPFITIGQIYTFNSDHFGNNGKMALWKFSHSDLSIEQVRKIYFDERRLFAENAKCTIYGTSAPVTAIAYDDKTNVIHAGTASGRSEFKGLQRINNTTTAVTTAISASNGLVAEQ